MRNERLRAACKARRVTLEHLSRELGISRKLLTWWSQHLYKPEDASTARLIARELRVDPDWLWAGCVARRYQERKRQPPPGLPAPIPRVRVGERFKVPLKDIYMETIVWASCTVVQSTRHWFRVRSDRAGWCACYPHIAAQNGEVRRIGGDGHG